MIRCFHRTFLCTPPTSDARSKNWPVSILHDSLYIGCAKQSKHAARVQTREEVMAAAAALSSPSKASVVVAGVTLNEHDQQQVEGLVRATGVDIETATKLLMQFHGNVDQAVDFVRQQAQAQAQAAAAGRPSV
jgi:acetaldehyde dehydrogenase (acetylating)